MTAAEATIRVDAYRAELLKRGLDANVTVQAVASVDDMEAAINATAGLRANANKYAILITNNTPADMTALQASLTNMGMDASVVTDTPVVWDPLTGSLDGSTYSLTQFSSADPLQYTPLALGMAFDTNQDVSSNNSLVADSMNIVSDMKRRLNAMANTMLREINYLHRSGMTMKDPPTYGTDFFVTINSGRPLEMGNIRLNPNLSDLSNIAASKTGARGDNSNALEIANLRNKSLIFSKPGIMSLDDYYQDIILHMGNNGSDSSRIAESQSKLVESADAARQAITGVSMDEEMTNMMKYKFAYDAASRVLNIIDSMMETVVNRLGMVGR